MQNLLRIALLLLALPTAAQLLTTAAAAEQPVSKWQAAGPWFMIAAGLSGGAGASGAWDAAPDGTAYRVPACGLNDAFTSAYCGRVNALGPPGGATNIAACDAVPGTPDKITAAGTYTIAAGLGAANQKCITVNANFSAKLTIYLEGALNGRLYISGNMNGGLEVYGASGAAINCSWISSGSDSGCLLATNSGGAMTAGYSFHDFSINNAADPGAGSSVGAAITMQNASWSGSGDILTMYNITGTTSTGTTSTRIPILYVVGPSSGGQTVASSYYNLHLTTAADSNAAQGLVLFCMKNTTVRNSYFNATQSTTAETSRAQVFDGDGGTNCAGNNVFKDSIVVANNNRAWRVRLSADTVMENVQVQNCRYASTAGGCVHLGDMTGDIDTVSPNITIINSRFEIRDGIGVGGRGITGNGVHLRNNVFTAHSAGATTGRAFSALAPTGTQTNTVFDAQNNSVAASIGSGASCTGGSATNSCAAANTQVTHCGGGTVSGTGAITTPACP